MCCPHAQDSPTCQHTDTASKVDEDSQTDCTTCSLQEQVMPRIRRSTERATLDVSHLGLLWPLVAKAVITMYKVCDSVFLHAQQCFGRPMAYMNLSCCSMWYRSRGVVALAPGNGVHDYVLIKCTRKAQNKRQTEMSMACLSCCP